jgi:hypothetical protein
MFHRLYCINFDQKYYYYLAKVCHYMKTLFVIYNFSLISPRLTR